MALRGDFNRMPARLFQPGDDSSEIARRSPKIMVRHHYARGGKLTRKFAPGHTLRRFNFNVAPAAAGAGSLRQDRDLFFPAASKQPSTFMPPACGNEHGARALAAQPGQESFPLFCAAKIIQSQFQSARLAQAQSDLRPHLARRFGGNNATHAILSEETPQAPSTPRS